MAGIFISYRRDETAAQARAIWERLCRELGRDHVFMDVAGIPAGGNFKKHIDAQLAGCRLMLVVVGAQWAGVTDRAGRPRLHAANDFVRYEVAAGLLGAAEERMALVPVLIDEAVMPHANELPDDLKDLVWIQAHELDFKRHTEASLSALVDLAGAAVRETASGNLLAIHPAPAYGLEELIATSKVVAAQSAVPAPPEPWMSAEGLDSYGRWADIQANGEKQRLRWIAPGRFHMGSPSGEAGRFDDEGPQHEVTLTRGYWLADTACTQALWQAVVGSNPSNFKGDLQRPVENVTWDEVTGLFLPKLKGLLRGGVEVVLPTEAEWEYACRAGTTRAFSFGDTFNPANAPVNAKGSVPAQVFSPNSWGLHQMHRNVFQWCADAPRTYGAEPVLDPHGGQVGARRVLRGGSWKFVVSNARSAARSDARPDYRSIYNGFRFALRSIEPGIRGR